MPTHSAQLEKATLRRDLRAQRRALDAHTQHHSALALARHLRHSGEFMRSRDIALYLAADGEIDTGPLLDLCRLTGKRCWLPVIGANSTMHFHRYRAGDRLGRNRFNLPQPLAGSPRIAPADLDLVLLPLVAFDRSGARLGMGGGFYDRTFAHTPRRRGKPLLVGLAHALQEVNKVPVQGWDRPLYAVATGDGVTRFGQDQFRRE